MACSPAFATLHELSDSLDHIGAQQEIGFYRVSCLHEIVLAQLCTSKCGRLVTLRSGLCLLQVPASIKASAQRVQVVPADSAPQVFVAGQGLPIVPRGSSELAIQVFLQTGALHHIIACACMVSALGSFLKENLHAHAVPPALRHCC